ncbi:hypothetical protein FPV67DRAFT_1453359 [Lyophyllum atratum]|nr:hypothetical protein FPV67DRAFT_1453359 [Lyophyllum atratum]
MATTQVTTTPLMLVMIREASKLTPVESWSVEFSRPILLSFAAMPTIPTQFLAANAVVLVFKNEQQRKCNKFTSCGWVSSHRGIKRRITLKRHYRNRKKRARKANSARTPVTSRIMSPTELGAFRGAST